MKMLTTLLLSAILPLVSGCVTSTSNYLSDGSYQPMCRARIHHGGPMMDEYAFYGEVDRDTYVASANNRLRHF